jgi:hypothetical protein
MKIAQQIAETFRKTRRLEIAKRTARSTVGMRKIKGWTLWRGRLPAKQKKEIVHRVRAGYVGAPATPRFIAPTVERESERESEKEEKKTLGDCVEREREKKLWMILITRTD